MYTPVAHHPSNGVRHVKCISNSIKSSIKRCKDTVSLFLSMNMFYWVSFTSKFACENSCMCFGGTWSGLIGWKTEILYFQIRALGPKSILCTISTVYSLYSMYSRVLNQTETLYQFTNSKILSMLNMKCNFCMLLLIELHKDFLKYFYKCLSFLTIYLNIFSSSLVHYIVGEIWIHIYHGRH